ncbi:unnamed protein product [Cuscuta epithymum]|uniref:Uncharacterized protein n=1 Tax=Cuscuta epithymum TaxID=186058 RepID=A0AAV0C4K7_9ASTE|nr:unnamed protein product [Cuscuta epithymum]
MKTNSDRNRRKFGRYLPATDNGNGRNAEAMNVENGGVVNEEDGAVTEDGKGRTVNEEDGGPNNARDKDLGGTGGGPVTQGVNEVPIFDDRDDYNCYGEGNSREKTNADVGGIFFDTHASLHTQCWCVPTTNVDVYRVVSVCIDI